MPNSCAGANPLTVNSADFSQLRSTPLPFCTANFFSFIISWATNGSVVLEACTNLAKPVWTPLQTNTLCGGVSYFSDPQWTNYPGRFYRVSLPRSSKRDEKDQKERGGAEAWKASAVAEASSFAKLWRTSWRTSKFAQITDSVNSWTGGLGHGQRGPPGREDGRGSARKSGRRIRRGFPG